ncbi:ribosomal RNA processing protein 36 homolog [Pelodytes ibericus]
MPAVPFMTCTAPADLGYAGCLLMSCTAPPDLGNAVCPLMTCTTPPDLGNAGCPLMSCTAPPDLGNAGCPLMSCTAPPDLGYAGCPLMTCTPPPDLGNAGCPLMTCTPPPDLGYAGCPLMTCTPPPDLGYAGCPLMTCTPPPDLGYAGCPLMTCTPPPDLGYAELSTMSFEELIHLQNKVGTKHFYRTAQGAGRDRHLDTNRLQLDRHEPLETSSKEFVPFLRKVTRSKKEMRRDPRFDDLSGEYKPEVFEKTYRFLDDVKKQERETIQKKMKKVRNPELKDKLDHLLRRMDQQEKATLKNQKLRERELEFKKEQREQAQKGKKPFYLKKGALRRLELADKFTELRKQGKLEHFLSKKRKRNSNKDRKRLPNL